MYIFQNIANIGYRNKHYIKGTIIATDPLAAKFVTDKLNKASNETHTHTHTHTHSHTHMYTHTHTHTHTHFTTESTKRL